MPTRCPVCHAPIDGASLRLDVIDGEASGFCRPPPVWTRSVDEDGDQIAGYDPDDEGRPLDRALEEE